MKISIIIPAFNEPENIVSIIRFLQKNSKGIVAQIIISDGGSTDNTLSLAISAGAVAIISPQKGRAAQMNYGAAMATGDILYFVHADTLPPQSFTEDIIGAVNKGYDFGRYRTRFDSSKFLLKINAWFTRFNWFICYGGDQTLFITRKLFEHSGGFKNELLIMEEYEFAERLMKQGRYKIFNDTALVSARKYDGRSWLKVQLANRKAVQSFKKGLSQQQIMNEYKMMLGKGE